MIARLKMKRVAPSRISQIRAKQGIAELRNVTSVDILCLGKSKHVSPSQIAKGRTLKFVAFPLRFCGTMARLNWFFLG